MIIYFEKILTDDKLGYIKEKITNYTTVNSGGNTLSVSANLDEISEDIVKNFGQAKVPVSLYENMSDHESAKHSVQVFHPTLTRYIINCLLYI